MATTKKGKKPSAKTVKATAKRSKATTTRTSAGTNRASFSQCNGVRERRHNLAPIGRPPEDPQARKRYNALKREDTPYEKQIQKKREQKAAKRAEDRIRKKEAQARAKRTKGKKSKEQTERDFRAAMKGKEMFDREEAMKVYQGWSINELRSDCKDYGISDYRKDWMKMSKQQLAVWLYKHRGSASRTWW